MQYIINIMPVVTERIKNYKTNRDRTKGYYHLARKKSTGLESNCNIRKKRRSGAQGSAHVKFNLCQQFSTQ